MRRWKALLMVSAITVAGVATCALVYDARRSLRAYHCSMNVENIAPAMAMYAADWGTFPDPDRWVDQLRTGYLRNDFVLKCAEDHSDARCSYGMNRALAGLSLARITNRDQLVVVYETANPGDSPSGGPEDVASPPRHPKGKSGGIFWHRGNMYGYASAKAPFEKQELPKEPTFEPELRPALP